MSLYKYICSVIWLAIGLLEYFTSGATTAFWACLIIANVWGNQ